MKCKVIEGLVEKTNKLKTEEECIVFLSENMNSIIDVVCSCDWKNKKIIIEEISKNINKINSNKNEIVGEYKTLIYYSILLKLNQTMGSKLQLSLEYISCLMELNIYNNEYTKTILGSLILKNKEEIDFLNEEEVKYIKEIKKSSYNMLLKILIERESYSEENQSIIEDYIEEIMNVDYPELSLLSQLRIIDSNSQHRHYKTIYDLCNTEKYSYLMEENRGVQILFEKSKNFLEIKG